MKKLIGCLVLAGSLVISCSKSNNAATAVDCSGSAKSFTTDVSPVIQSNCTASPGCHASGSSSSPGTLITYQQVYDARSSIRSAVLSGVMPQNGRLSSGQKNAIVCWIDNGAANN